MEHIRAKAREAQAGPAVAPEDPLDPSQEPGPDSLQAALPCHRDSSGGHGWTTPQSSTPGRASFSSLEEKAQTENPRPSAQSACQMDYQPWVAMAQEVLRHSVRSGQGSCPWEPASARRRSRRWARRTRWRGPRPPDAASAEHRAAAGATGAGASGPAGGLAAHLHAAPGRGLQCASSREPLRGERCTGPAVGERSGGRVPRPLGGPRRVEHCPQRAGGRGAAEQPPCASATAPAEAAAAAARRGSLSPGLPARLPGALGPALARRRTGPPSGSSQGACASRAGRGRAARGGAGQSCLCGGRWTGVCRASQNCSATWSLSSTTWPPPRRLPGAARAVWLWARLFQTQ